LRIAVCDDDQNFLQQAKQLLDSWVCPSGTHLTEVFSDGDALISAHGKSPFDIILLDVVMPLLSGMEAAREIRQTDKTVKLVFLTSSPEFAVESYTVKADNYLLKPINKERFFACLDELKADLEAASKSITVKSPAAVHRIKLLEIEHLESQGKHVFFSLSGSRSLYGMEPLYTYEKALTLKDGFFKCHRSYLVNIHKIRTFTPKEITMNSGIRIPISRSCQKEFETAYFTTLFGKAGDL
jgi:DNA-binding LytR/AlgR family response regulator